MNNNDSPPGKAHPPTNQANHIAIALVLVVGAMTSAAFLAKFGIIPYEAMIFVSGTVGGVVNSFQRIQRLATSGVQNYDPVTQRLIITQIYVSPFVGGIFAFVLYIIFMADFVQGPFFPAFESGAQPYTSFSDFAMLFVPKTNADVAKAIIWAFIAGFSEGLVPNFISKITNDSTPGGER